MIASPGFVRKSAFLLCLPVMLLASPPCAHAQDSPPAITKESIAGLEEELKSTREGASEARQRLAVRRVIRDAEELVAAHPNDNSRFLALEFLFRARQQLLALDKDSKHREDLLATCRELVKAPDQFAELRLEADLLLSQAELARQGAGNQARADALRPFVDRYLDTPAGARVLRMAMVMALELGDNRLVNHLQETIEKRFAADLEMINFQRDKLGGQVIGAPFAGTFERSDGKTVRFPMDGLGRTTMLVFWSKENDGEKLLDGVAAAAIEKKADLAGRLEIVSFNLDNLPDAGESIVRALGVDWQVLKLPGGKENPVFSAYVRSDPRIVSVSPTGYTALIMAGSTRQKANPEGEPDYGRMFQSSLAREWTDERYVMHLASLMAGDFLVLDPEGPFDPSLPPEWKATGKGETVKPLERSAECVPEATLRTIQDAFVMPPRRYRLSHAEARAAYAEAAALCRKAIADHPAAPDLWIVRNRLMVSLLGLWKTDSDHTKLNEAAAEAKAAMDAGYPPGCDIIARLCIARGKLRDPAANQNEIIDKMLAAESGGPALAAASLLALDVADRKRFEDCRKAILQDHTEYPMMWLFTSFLLDRHHDYWLFQVPFTAGWSYGRRQRYFMNKGDAGEDRRVVRTELQTEGGKILRIPEDLDSEWTVILFSQSPPWSQHRDDGLSVSPVRLLQTLHPFAASRPAKDVKIMLASLGGDPETIRTALAAERNPVECEVASLPDGMANPLVHRLGILSEDKEINGVLLRKDGSIALMQSGYGRLGGNAMSINNTIAGADENTVNAMLERGEVEQAKSLIHALAPNPGDNPVDAKGRKIKPPEYNLAHLRARARVYMALKEWDLARADAEEVVQRQMSTDGGMSLRTPELDASEALRDSILEQSARARP
jgi:hypothetical protein